MYGWSIKCEASKFSICNLKTFLSAISSARKADFLSTKLGHLESLQIFVATNEMLKFHPFSWSDCCAYTYLKKSYLLTSE